MELSLVDVLYLMNNHNKELEKYSQNEYQIELILNQIIKNPLTKDLPIGILVKNILNTLTIVSNVEL